MSPKPVEREEKGKSGTQFLENPKWKSSLRRRGRFQSSSGSVRSLVPSSISPRLWLCFRLMFFPFLYPHKRVSSHRDSRERGCGGSTTSSAHAKVKLGYMITSLGEDEYRSTHRNANKLITRQSVAKNDGVPRCPRFWSTIVVLTHVVLPHATRLR